MPIVRKILLVPDELVIREGQEYRVEADPVGKRGKRKGDGAINDSDALAQIKALIGQGTTTHAACQSIAAELKLSDKQTERAVNRWEKKLRREKNE